LVVAQNEHGSQVSTDKGVSKPAQKELETTTDDPSDAFTAVQ
jgi:hypothetical protein